MIQKLYVVPHELFDSLLRKSKIIDDPVLRAQLEMEKEKEQILQEPLENPDSALMKYSDAALKEGILEEQRKMKLGEPLPIKIVTPETKIEPVKFSPPEIRISDVYKRKTIPRTHRLPVLSKQKLLQQFYTYEPKMAKDIIKQMARETPGSSSGFKTPVSSVTPKKKRLDPVLQGVDVSKIPAFKQTRTGREY